MHRDIMAGHNMCNAAKAHLLYQERPRYLQPVDGEGNYPWENMTGENTEEEKEKMEEESTEERREKMEEEEVEEGVEEVEHLGVKRGAEEEATERTKKRMT